MKTGVSRDDPDTPEDIAELIDSAEVVVFRSNLTDTRALQAWLEQHRMDHRIVTMGMGSPVERDRYHRLRDWCGWNLLPAVFVRGRFVGGADEFFAAVRSLGLDEAGEASP